MSDTTAIRLSVNGEDVAILARWNTTLLDALRDQLHLTGTKRGCSYGVCGACTILLDGRAARSCLSLAAAGEGCRITTIEGLGADGTAQALREAFIANGAAQCGYCTPGIIVALTSLLGEPRAAPPTADDIRHWLGGNICRCTGYVKIVDAVLAAADALAAAPEARKDVQA